MSGLLNPKMGGPSVFPELPDGMGRRAAAGRSRAADERNRRSVYIFVRRNTRYPMLEAFDMPDTHETCPRRNVTTTAPQALTLLNNKMALEWAQAFAGRALSGRRIRSTRPSGWRTRARRTPWEKDTSDVPPSRRARSWPRGARREAGVPAGCRRLEPDTRPRSWIFARC